MKKTRFTVELPDYYDTDDIYRLVSGLNDCGAIDVTENEGTVTGEITKQSRDAVVEDLRERKLTHNIKPKKTFWREEDNTGDMELRGDRIVQTIAAILGILIIPRSVTTKLLDYYWYQQFGLENIVFMKNLTTFIYMFVAIFIIMTIVSQINWRMMKGWIQKIYDSNLDEISIYYHIGTVIISLILALVISALKWRSWLEYVNRVPFGETDPIFGNDIGFYVFELPFIKSVLFWSFAFITILLIIDMLICKIEDDNITWRERIPFVMRLLTTLAVFIVAAFMFLRKYNLLYSDFGVVAGLGYTEMHIWMPAYWILGLVITLIGIAFLIYPLIGKLSEEGFGIGVVTISVVLVFIVGLLLAGAVGVLYQEYVTKPAELENERQYLDHNIRMTREAYGLENINERFYPVATDLDLSILDSPTIKNTRIYDYRPLLMFLDQKHALRTYYDIQDVDVDRYTINGELTEVLVAPREINQKLLPRKTWINEHFVYTHGKGVTVNPVGITDSEGNPVMFVEKIPPVSTVPELEITQPNIYYGQLTNGMIFTNTNQQEFDYPMGDSDSIAYTTYNGTGGIELSTPLRKFVAAWRNSFLGIKVYQADLTSDSRIHLVRNVNDRVEKIAPYLYFDEDPYIVIDDDGRLIWMMSAMAHTRNYPYSERSSVSEFESFNYIRDSVKIVLDAEGGEPTFYLINEDPIMRVYQKIYPGLFKPISEMPESQKDHLKYPEDLLTYQAKMLAVYQMNNTDTFYNKEDVWKIAREIHGLEEVQEVEPYNVVLEIENKTEFMLMLPLTPLERANMVAWFSACQDTNYGNLTLYRFPRDAITHGPMQIENLIDEDEDISKDMSLWNTGGSSVIRGNLLVIPIRESLLYIEPVFILADREDSMPELKRVIVVYNGKIAMTESLEESIRQVIDPEAVIEIGGKEVKLTNMEIVAEANETVMIIVVYDEDHKEIGRFPIRGNHTFSVIPQ